MEEHCDPFLLFQANPPHTSHDTNPDIHSRNEESAASQTPPQDSYTQHLSLDRYLWDGEATHAKQAIVDDESQLLFQRDYTEPQNQPSRQQSQDSEEDWDMFLFNQPQTAPVTDTTDPTGGVVCTDDSPQSSLQCFPCAAERTESRENGFIGKQQSWQFTHYQAQPRDNNRDPDTKRKVKKRPCAAGADAYQSVNGVDNLPSEKIQEHRTYVRDASDDNQTMEKSSKIRRKIYVKPYIQFCNGARARVRRAYPLGTNKEIMQIIAREWAALSPQEKADYNAPRNHLCFHMETPTTYIDTHVTALKKKIGSMGA